MHTRKLLTAAVMSMTTVAGATALAAPPAGRGGPVTPPPELGDVKTAPTPTPEKTPVLRQPADAAPPAPVGPPKPAPQASKPAMDFNQVMYDQPGDGSLWARGRTYKAQFAADGFTYVPFLGSDAPRNYPIKFVLQGIDAAGRALSFNDGQPMRDGDRVVIDRGLVQEVYLLTPDSIEQEFIFTGKPGDGDVVIRMAVESDLASADAGDLLRFSNDLGGVTYTEAVTIDADGRAVDSPTSLVNGSAIEIRLPASMVEDAAYPITVDPIINTFVTAQTTILSDAANPDVAYDDTDDGYAIVWEYNFSAADGDIYSERVDYDGDPIDDSLTTIDSTTSNWRNPSIANNQINSDHLIVAERGAVGARQVWCRIRDASSNTTGAQTQVSDGVSFGGDQFNADVGGDPFTGGGFVAFCVVWERVLSASDHDIFARLVVPVSGATSGGVILIENTGSSIFHNPSISNSNNEATWNVVYQKTFDFDDEDIYGARINYDGNVTEPNFLMDFSGLDHRNPAVSGNVGGNFMVVYEQDPAGAADIFARVFSNATSEPESSANLTSLENIQTGTARRRPAIDSNSDHFMVITADQFDIGDWDPYVSVYCYTGSIRVAEQHRNLDWTGSDTIGMKIASMYSSGGDIAPSEFMPVWDMTSSGFGEVEGAYAFARESCCRTDVFSDGATGVSDLLTVISGWGPCPEIDTAYGLCTGDIDGDFSTGVVDLLSVISAWGPCP